MVIRISDKTQNYSKVTKLLVKPKEFKTYLMGFIKAIKKNRIHREPLFRESSLINFVSELNDSHL